jgi:hypothetical protein
MKDTKISGQAASSLGYTGIVTLSQCTKTRKILLHRAHNSGGKALFDYLAACLAGDFTKAKNNRPTKIMLLNIDESGNKSRAGNSRFISLLSGPEVLVDTDATESAVRYSFTIPPEDILGANNINALGLYTQQATDSPDDLNNAAAYCMIDLSNVPNISLSSILVLDWELHIANQA